MYEIHSKTDCPWCEKAKAFLEARQLPYVEYRYDDYDERQAMYDRFKLAGKKRTVPQIFYTHGSFKEYIGGCRDLLHHPDATERLQMEDFNAEF